MGSRCHLRQGTFSGVNGPGPGFHIMWLFITVFTAGWGAIPWVAVTVLYKRKLRNEGNYYTR